MGFSVEPNIIEISDIPTLSSQIASIDAANDNVLSELETKGAVVPETYKQYTLDLFKDIFVAIATGSSTAVYSANGITWTVTTLPIPASSAPPTKVIYANGKFIFANSVFNYSTYTYNSTAISSTDGITWASSAMPSRFWGSMAYGNGKFIALSNISDAVYLAYSVDGITWTEINLTQSNFDMFYNWSSIVYANNKFVAVAYSTLGSASELPAAYSNDGISWTIATMPSGTNWGSVTYGNNKFVAVGNSSTAAYSTDGITWTASTMPSSSSWNLVAYGNGKFVAVAYNSSTAAYSTDGITWTASQINYSSPWISLTYGIGKFIVVNNNGLSSHAYSTDGISWIPIYLPSHQYTSVSSGQNTITKTIAEILGVN